MRLIDASALTYRSTSLPFVSLGHERFHSINDFFKGVSSLDALHGCSDSFLTETVGMKKAHRLKFRRALKDAHIELPKTTMSLYKAPDGAFLTSFPCHTQLYLPTLSCVPIMVDLPCLR